MNKKRRTITLKIEGERIPADKLRKTIGDFFNLLDEVSFEVIGKRKQVNWFVSVKSGSVVLAADPEPKTINVKPTSVNAICDSFKKGIKTLEEKGERPSYFNDKALEIYQDLATVPSFKEEGIEKISIAVDEEPIKVTKHAIEHIDDILGTFYKALGSVEGRLQTISERGALRILVYEALTDRAVSCHIDDFMLEDAIRAFGKRVYVYGLVSYGRQGWPKSIVVEDMRIFPEDEDIPSPLDVCGILGA